MHPFSFLAKTINKNLQQQGNFSIYPSDGMIPAIRRDYQQMSTMIFGETPTFDDILTSIKSASELLQSN